MLTPGVASPSLPHRSRMSGSEVVQIVESALSALRAERDQARALLTDVLNDAGPQLSPQLVERITTALDAP